MCVVAIIGCGRIANFALFPALNKLDNVGIKYACDIIIEKAKKAKTELLLGLLFSNYNTRSKRLFDGKRQI